MVNDRNLTVHTYNEQLAVRIHSQINSYFLLMSDWIQRMEERV